MQRGFVSDVSNVRYENGQINKQTVWSPAATAAREGLTHFSSVFPNSYMGFDAWLANRQ